MRSTMKSRNSDDLVNNREETECDEEFSQIVIDYQKQVENLIADLFCMEEQLMSSTDESLEQELQNATFDQVLAKYAKHEEFIGKFCEFSQVVMKCQDRGHEIRENDNLSLEEHERDQVNIQIDALLVCYEKLKILASDRLRRLQSILEDRQQLNVQRFEQWLSNIELKVCNATNIGPDYKSILRQTEDMKKLSHELGNKQEFLNFMSNVIFFDEIESEPIQMRTKSQDNLDTRLENMNARWEKVCLYVQDRNDKLKRADSLWRIVNSEWPPIMRWIKKTKRSLDEISEALKNLTGNCQSDKAFVQKLIPRYDKIKSDIKGKQSLYSQLESRVREDIEQFDDPCSMLVIEIEKKLEELQRSWDELKNQKRKIHFTLESLSITNLNNSNCNPISGNEDLVSLEDEGIRLKHSLDNHSDEQPQVDKDNVNNSILDSLHSSENEEKEFDETNSISETRGFDSSFSPNSKSNLLSTNNLKELSSSLNNSQDELSSIALTTPVKLSTLLARAGLETNHQVENCPNNNNYTIDVLGQNYDQHHEEHHNCRVEEWKHSLESFSNWIKDVESILGLAETIENCSPNEPIQSNWSKLDLDRQFHTLNEIEASINSRHGEELDHLIVQGQQIIEDLIPEIGDNNYEVDLKKILNDIKTRYDLVIKCLAEKRYQISDKNRWSELLNTMKASCLFVIGRTGQLLPETEIGYDLITLAQQQDQLMQVKEEVRSNSTVETCKKEAKLFLKFCDILDGNPQASSILNHNNREFDVELRNSFVKLKDGISNQLDILSLHLSEFFQLVDERLEHLAEVYKDMHALKQKIQEFAPKLQVAEILKSNWESIEGLSVEQLSEQLEDLKLFRERLSDAESSHKVMNLILDRMNHLGVPLSQQNLNQINELNSTWSLILEDVNERQKHIENAFDNQGSPEHKYLERTLDDMPDWVRKVAVSKVPYFIDRKTNESSWDHPKFKRILNEMSLVKQVVFSAYRIALQLRIIQKSLGLELLMLEDLDEVLYEPNLRDVSKQSRSGSGRRCYYKTLYGVEQILPILKAIFKKVKEEKPSLDLALSMELTLNWLLNLYDPTRTGYISALSLKIGLTVLCCATLEEKHSSIYRYVLDDVDSCHKDNDGHAIVDILRVFTRIPIYLGEGDAFSDREVVLEESMFSCFVHADQAFGIELIEYMNWIKDEPQIVIWLVVLHRLLVSEDVMHKMKCKLCKAKPITGLRYKCLKCLSYNICQNCFLTGRHIDEHHEDHEMREYCSVTNSDGKVRNIARVLGNKIKS